MNRPVRIYLDNAATSWPKPAKSVQAAVDFITQCGATAGRGTYTSALEADRWLAEARLQVARLIGAQQADSIAFTSSGSHALNAALLGLLAKGDHVVTTQVEHNSLLRPLYALQSSGLISVDHANCTSNGFTDLDHVQSLIRPQTKLVAVNHASNVTGAVQNLRGFSELAKRAGKILLVDASQTLGYLPIDVQQIGIDVLAAAAHKGLRALQGNGLLYVARSLQTQLRPLMTGGTGLQSERIDAPHTWPQVVEVGNLNLPGIVSIAVCAKELNDAVASGHVQWQLSWRKLFERMIAGLSRIPAVQLIGHSPTSMKNVVEAIDSTCVENYVPLVSLQMQGWSPHDLAAVLDANFGIEVRAGFHCAALIHHAIGSESDGGTLRISLGHSTTEAEVDTLLSALTEIAS